MKDPISHQQYMLPHSHEAVIDARRPGHHSSRGENRPPGGVIWALWGGL